MSTAPPADVARERSRPWQILGSGGFRSLWAAHLLTLVGDTFSIVALPWLVLQLTGSGVAVGAVLATEAVPRALLMLVGGAVTDRFSPRRAMIASSGVRAVLIGLLAVLVLGHGVQLWHVYAVALLAGCISAFFMPARFAVLPSVVADDQLEAGNALLNLNQQVSIFVGPALAGLLVAAAGPGPAFLVDAAGFGLASVLLLSMPGRPAAASSGGGPLALLSEIGEGLRAAWDDVGLRASLLLIAVVNIATAGSMEVGLPVLAHERFSQGAAAFGSLLAAWGIGSTAGVVVAGLRRWPVRFGPLVIVCVAWIGVSIGLIGVAPTLPLALAAVAVGGVAGGFVNTHAFAWLQRRAEPAVLGRVMSLVMLSSLGLAPLSLIVAGLLASQPVLLFGTSAAIMVAGAVGAALSPTFRRL